MKTSAAASNTVPAAFGVLTALMAISWGAHAGLPHSAARLVGLSAATLLLVVAVRHASARRVHRDSLASSALTGAFWLATLTAAVASASGATLLARGPSALGAPALTVAVVLAIAFVAILARATPGITRRTPQPTEIAFLAGALR